MTLATQSDFEETNDSNNLNEHYNTLTNFIYVYDLNGKFIDRWNPNPYSMDVSIDINKHYMTHLGLNSLCSFGQCCQLSSNSQTVVSQEKTKLLSQYSSSIVFNKKSSDNNAFVLAWFRNDTKNTMKCNILDFI